MIAARAAPEERPQHASDEALEAYVMGLMDVRSLPALEEHVSACLPCARRLATEARRELALTAALAAAPARVKEVRVRQVGARRHHGALLAAAAAALALVTGLGQQRTGRSPFTEGAVNLSTAAAELSEREATPRPLLACLQDGEDALCAARSPDLPRSVERASRWPPPAGEVTAEICLAPSGTCPRQSRPQ